MEHKGVGIQDGSIEMIIDSIEEMKELLSSDLWNNMFLNCSKNEVLIFWFLYQKGEVNMSDIADYIHVPLNTATGIVARMEKNEMVLRNRSAEDKRVVLIRFSDKGQAQFNSLMKELIRYGTEVLEAFSPEEVALFFRMIAKAKEVLRREKKKEEAEKSSAGKVRRITIE